MKHLFSVVLVLFFAGIVSAQTLNDLKWMTEEYPPYNFTENGQTKGIAVDTLLEMWKRAGVQKTAKDIAVYPWARGVSTMEKNKGNGLFSTTVTPKRKNILKYQFVSPIPGKSESGNHIVAPKSAHIKITSTSELKKYHIGAVLDDVGQEFIEEAKVPKDHIITCNSGEQLVNMMDKKRFDVVSYEYKTFCDTMKEHKLDPAQYEIVYTFPPMAMGYAFNKDTDPALIKKLQTALDSINSDGTGDKIVKKYMH